MFRDRWKPYILIAICREGSFSPEAASKKWRDASFEDLCCQFRQLEEDRLIFQTSPDKFGSVPEYRLTETGKRAIPILEAIYNYAVGDMLKKGIAVNQRASDDWEPNFTHLENSISDE